MTTTEPVPGAADVGPAPSRRGLRWLLSAVTVSSLGDGAFVGALPLAAAAITRDPAAVAVVSVAATLPWLLVTPVAGALVDRWPYRPVMVITDLARGLGLAVLTVLVATGNATIPALAIGSFIVVCGQIFHDTAVQGTVPLLAGRNGVQLDRFNGRVYGAETAGKALLGPPAGSASYAITPWVPFAADAVSFLASASLLSRLPREMSSGHREDAALWRAIKNGAAWLAHHRQLRTILLVSSTANLAYAMAWAVFVLLATDPAGLAITPAAFGLLVATYAVGGVVAGPLTGHVDEARRMSPELLGEVPHLGGLSLSVWLVGYRMLCGVSTWATFGVASRVTTAMGAPQWGQSRVVGGGGGAAVLRGVGWRSVSAAWFRRRPSVLQAGGAAAPRRLPAAVFVVVHCGSSGGQAARLFAAARMVSAWRWWARSR